MSNAVTAIEVDHLALACRAAWEAHAAIVKTGTDAEVKAAYVATLRADLALTKDCAAKATGPGAIAAYALDIAALEAEIEDYA